MKKAIEQITIIVCIAVFFAIIAFADGLSRDNAPRQTMPVKTAVTTSTSDKPAEPVQTVRTQAYEPYIDYINRIPEDSQPVEIPEEEIVLLTKTVWGEARGCSPDEQRLVVWTIFQRVDNGNFGKEITGVITAKGQFIGYRENNPIDSEIYDLCVEEYLKWKQGEEAPILEPYVKEVPYYFFEGKRGEDGELHNYFRENWT